MMKPGLMSQTDCGIISDTHREGYGCPCHIWSNSGGPGLYYIAIKCQIDFISSSTISALLTPPAGGTGANEFKQPLEKPIAINLLCNAQPNVSATDKQLESLVSRVTAY